MTLSFLNVPEERSRLRVLEWIHRISLLWMPTVVVGQFVHFVPVFPFPSQNHLVESFHLEDLWKAQGISFKSLFSTMVRNLPSGLTLFLVAGNNEKWSRIQ